MFIRIARLMRRAPAAAEVQGGKITAGSTRISSGKVDGRDAQRCAPAKPRLHVETNLFGSVDRSLVSSPKRRDGAKLYQSRTQNPSNVRTPKAAEDTTKFANRKIRVDTLVRANVKAAQERHTLERTQRLRHEEQRRRVRARLAERNRAIHEENARSLSRTMDRRTGNKNKGMHCADRESRGKKLAGASPSRSQSHHRTESERRTRLGLSFVDMQAQFRTGVSRRENGGGICVADKEEEGQKKLVPQKEGKVKAGIRQYMLQKRSRIQKERRARRQDETAKRARIAKNISHLRTIVSRIFSRPKVSGDNLRIHLVVPHKSDNKAPPLNSDLSCLNHPPGEIMPGLRCEPGTGSAQLRQTMQQVATRLAVQAANATTIQRWVRGYLSRRKQAAAKSICEKCKPTMDESGQDMSLSFEVRQNLGRILQGGQSQNEKVVHLSRINTLDEPGSSIKSRTGPEPNEPSVAVQAHDSVEEAAKESKAAETQTGTEDAARRADSVVVQAASGDVMKRQKSLFDRDPFQEFVVGQRRRDVTSRPDTALVIEVREQVLRYKASTEKHCMRKMYRAKCLTPKAYQSRRKALERWVTREKAEIKRAKKSLEETWTKTAQMIEDANRSAIQIRRVISGHTLSYFSDSGSTLSLLLDSARAATDRPYGECGAPIKILDQVLPEAEDSETAQTGRQGLKRDKSVDSLSELAGSLPTTEKIVCQQNFRELYESDSDLSAGNQQEEGERTAPPDPECPCDLSKALPSQNETAIAKAAEASSTAERLKVVDTIVTALYNRVIDELLSAPFPHRLAPARIATREMGRSGQTGYKLLMQSLAAEKSGGIRTDSEYVDRYICKLFSVFIASQRTRFVEEINRAIARSPAEVLSNLKATSVEHDLVAESRLPHEMSPIVPTGFYLEMEAGTQQDFTGECKHIHDKAVFDSVNEALNLIRPYGTAGEPMPWSLQQRILFRSIADPAMVVRNIKSMVRFFRARG